MFGTKLVDPVALGAAVGAAGSGLNGLDVVEDEIGGVLDVLQTQATAIEALDFANKAHIAKGSFGSGNEAVQLSVDHTKAHGVIVDTLNAMITDLSAFQDAVIHARGLIREADDQADLDLRTVLASTEDLDLGQRAHVNAQVEHSTDQPTEEPTTDQDGA
ncbi:hypothetical protein ACFQ0K_03850 [Nocardioides caeni]|uniref:Uncharacterized protein n=1 Tax=Nocardioides caeni TaxID=574700 RepID=A0A4V4HJ44_9ACTN|nr:hypothetical protein [Nocardioides caeni]THV09056.1 hypothetical protein E9934_17890 [Nocardioides caeni]